MFHDALVFNQPLNSWDTSSATQIRNMFEGASAFNQPIRSWDVSSVDVSAREMFKNAIAFNQPLDLWVFPETLTTLEKTDMFDGATSYDFCLPSSFYLGATTNLNLGLAADFSTNCTAYNQRSAAPYFGPIVRPMMEVETTAGVDVQISGFRLDTVQRVTVGDQELTTKAIDNSTATITLPTNLEGLISLTLHWENGERSGSYRVPNAFVVSTAQEEELNSAEASNQKVNAGSFKGYVAVYAKGYEGQRLSAKIGNDWVIVDPIVNNESANLARIVDFTGAGVDIAVRIYIDRVLMDTINLTTK